MRGGYVRGRSRLEDALITHVPLPAPGRLTEFPDGFRLLFDPRSSLDRKLYFRNCEPDTYRFLRSALGTRDVFVDCGANLGFYTVLAGITVGDTGRVVSFEPSPETHQKLAANVAANELTNVTLHQLALGREPGVSHIHRICDVNPGMDPIIGEPGAASFACRVKTFDAVLAEDHVVPTVIKIDVEGAELDLLAGAARTLEASLAPTLVLELSPFTAHRFGHEPEDIVAHLAAVRDYEILWPHRGRLEPVDPQRPLPHYAVTGPVEVSNYVFRPRGG